MVMLVTVQQAKDRLKLDDNSLTEADLIGIISQASAAVLNYLKVGFERYADSSGNVPTDSSGLPVGVPDEVQLAVLTLVGIIVRDPDAADTEKWTQGNLPFAVTVYIYQLRDPALA